MERVRLVAPSTRSKDYSRRLRLMYFRLQREQRQGADFSDMDDFLEELSALVGKHERQPLRKTA